MSTWLTPSGNSLSSLGSWRQMSPSQASSGHIPACTHTLLITLPCLIFSLALSSLPAFMYLLMVRAGVFVSWCSLFCPESWDGAWHSCDHKCLLNKWTCNLLLYGWGFWGSQRIADCCQPCPIPLPVHSQGTAWYLYKIKIMVNVLLIFPIFRRKKYSTL